MVRTGLCTNIMLEGKGGILIQKYIKIKAWFP